VRLREIVDFESDLLARVDLDAERLAVELGRGGNVTSEDETYLPNAWILVDVSSTRRQRPEPSQ
jgi:hypothetical protein